MTDVSKKLSPHLFQHFVAGVDVLAGAFPAFLKVSFTSSGNNTHLMSRFFLRWNHIHTNMHTFKSRHFEKAQIKQKVSSFDFCILQSMLFHGMVKTYRMSRCVQIFDWKWLYIYSKILVFKCYFSRLILWFIFLVLRSFHYFCMLCSG